MVKAGYKQTEVGEIPEDWELNPIGQHFDFKNGLNKAKEFFGHGTPIINYMDVFSNPGVANSDIAGKVVVTKDEINSYSARKGDVFFTRTSETVDEIGLSTVLTEEVKDAVFSGFVLRAREKGSDLDLHFKKYCFRSESARKQIKATSSYTTRALTNGKLLSQVLLAYPKNPDEQKAIADALSDVDTLIVSLEKLIEKKRDIKTATMQQLLTGKKRLPGFVGDWTELQFAEFTTMRSGAGFPLGLQGDVSSKTPFFKVSDFNHSENATFMRRSNNYLSEERVSQYGYKPIPENSIVIAKIGAAIFLERKRILDRKSLIDNNMMALIFEAFVANYRFLHQLLLTVKLSDLVSTTALPSLSASDIGALQISLPCLEEQAAIADVLVSMDEEIDFLGKRLTKAQAIKQGMMQELLTGRTRVV